ncbi:hypothetical protein FGO68_gene10482 [Halteria grandinella]|uniref:Uncharacterized protein n=1 Tax=Halteria grandinella TaxID=5974 RepID=A0A8J8NN74_HALGN|nr:hypothetical protein FGO68_gene10482 [Halteria grandinella]
MLRGGNCDEPEDVDCNVGAKSYEYDELPQNLRQSQELQLTEQHSSILGLTLQRLIEEGCQPSLRSYDRGPSSISFLQQSCEPYTREQKQEVKHYSYLRNSKIPAEHKVDQDRKVICGIPIENKKLSGNLHQIMAMEKDELKSYSNGNCTCNIVLQNGLSNHNSYCRVSFHDGEKQSFNPDISEQPTQKIVISRLEDVTLACRNFQEILQSLQLTADATVKNNIAGQSSNFEGNQKQQSVFSKIKELCMSQVEKKEAVKSKFRTHNYKTINVQKINKKHEQQEKSDSEHLNKEDVSDEEADDIPEEGEIILPNANYYNEDSEKHSQQQSNKIIKF